MTTIIKYSMLYFILTTGLLFACPHDKHTIISLQNPDELENLLQKNQGPCLIYLSMEKCGWCAQVSPLVKQLSQDDNFCDHITFYQAYGQATQAPDLVKKYLKKTIQGYPTLLFLKSGKLIDIQAGGTSLKNLEQKLTKLLK